MKTKILCWTIVTGLGLMAGCGKNEQPAPTPSEASKAASPAKVEPAKAPEKPVAQETNSPAAVTNAAQPVTEAAPVKAVEPATLASSTPANTSAAPAAALLETKPSGSNKPGGLASLSQDQMVQGLQAALGKGLQQAIANLGHEGGFLTNLNVKIPMPEKLQKVESTLRAMKQDKLADDFVVTMNRAAEQAVPEAGSVFAEALQHMTIEDGKSILAGPNDAATQYFQKATSTNLYAKFYPIVQKATEKTGVTAAYKNLMAKADMTKSLGSLGNAISGSVLDKDTMDVDAYVTNKTMDGLFKMVAEEEKQIRQNPAARTTELLQKVFGAVGK